MHKRDAGNVTITYPRNCARKLKYLGEYAQILIAAAAVEPCWMKGKIGKGNQVERQIRRTKNAKKKNELEILEYLQEPNCPIVSDL